MTGRVAEVLEASGGPRRSSRWWGVLLVLLLVVVGTAWIVDRRVRQSEERALEECLASARVAVDDAYLPASRRWSNVRPALDGGASIMVRVSLYHLVSEAAVGRSSQVAAARARCADVRVLAIHPALRQRRGLCLRLLDDHVDFLDRAAVDGRVLGEVWPRSVASC